MKTALKCNIADCQCEQFFPGNSCNLSVRSCDECKHSFVNHVINLNELDTDDIIKHLAAEHIYELCTLCLYGTTVISPRIKILLDRILDTLTQAEQDNILKSLKWSIDDYEKSYIEHNFTNSSSNFNLIMPSSDEEDQYLLPQFLRFESTRLLAQYFLQVAQQQQRITPHCPSSNGRSPSPPATESKPTVLPSGNLSLSAPAPAPAPPPPSIISPAANMLLRPPGPFPFPSPWPSTDMQMMNFLMAQLSNPLMMNYDFRRIGNNLLPTAAAAATAAAATRNIPSVSIPKIKEESNGKHYDLPEINNNQIDRKNSMKRKRICSPLNLSTTSRSPTELPASNESIARISDSSLSSKSSLTNNNHTNNSSTTTTPTTTTTTSTSRKRLSLSEQRVLISPHGKKRVQCNVCMKTFCDKGALKIHFSAVHLREMHRCTTPGCTMMFSSRRSRNRHSANPNPKLHLPRPNAMSHRYHTTGPIISDGKHQSQVNLYMDDDDDDNISSNISSSMDDQHEDDRAEEELVS
ncbi:unnamed protein product [Rotaria socialis]|uniref:C2H2-type domain-containing protein n=6 Tax=Rotaria socialis TaxID=392032 RepID=A0A818ATT5_9BILA|nr:unnamed protein product [Rotaria socialis]CAF3417238.1 unnamed protein product [Rotaria socialis]CAF3441598.1 unnamed protein product [Rotaria socialis]CAF3470350.1 unnamed protein product [Rotaria socialis]CAF3670331.1 unnamed protein product [Rotaria socialis]